MVRVNVELDLPPGVELLGYERSGDGHGFEVKFPLPDSCRCEKCGHEEPSTYEYKNTVHAVRDLDLGGSRVGSSSSPASIAARAAGIGSNEEKVAARVITKRCYGVKSSGTLWNRLILDLNRASEAAGRSIAELREIVTGLKAVFLAFCT